MLDVTQKKPVHENRRSEIVEGPGLLLVERLLISGVRGNPTWQVTPSNMGELENLKGTAKSWDDTFVA